jgi:hypothetical protein
MNIKDIGSKIKNINIRTLIKIVPFAFALHEFEEWNILAWHQKHQSNIPAVADIDLRTIFLFLVVLVFIVFNLALIPRNKKITAYILFPFISFMCYNGVVHLYWTIYFKDYSPGLIFGFFVGVPLTGLILYKMLKERMVKKWYAFIFGGLVSYLFIEVIILGDKLEPGIVNAMLFGQKLAQWLFQIFQP